VKKLKLHLANHETWCANFFKSGEYASVFSSTNGDLNRAICECVAKMQAAKETQ
jgi:hypothetical protein